LAGIAGRPAVEVFSRLIDIVCPPGGTIDEAIARLGMLQAIESLSELGTTAFEDLTAEQMQEFVIAFIAGTIEARVINDVGNRSIELPTDIAKVENIQSQLHDAVTGCVSQAIQSAGSLAALSAGHVARVTDSIYESAFSLLAALAEQV
jgi:hypothetical protein